MAGVLRLALGAAVENMVITAAGALWAWRRDRVGPPAAGFDDDATWPPLDAVPMRAAAVSHIDNGEHDWVDANADGTRTYRWRVRMADFDQIHGVIRAKVDRIEYRLK